MVAISLYRGNLHRVPDVPRRWLMPTPKISLKDFKSLLDRRSKALSRLNSTTSNPDPNQQNEAPKEIRSSIIEPKLEPDKVGDCGEAPEKDQTGLDGGDCSVKAVDASEIKAEKNDSVAVVADINGQDLPKETKPADLANPNSEPEKDEEKVSNKVEVDGLNGKEKRKREVEDKLETLNAKKHNLVLALKQILNAEEELKRRNSMQGMAIRPSVSLQGDGANDTGSLTRHNTPRMGSEANLGGDMDGAEADDPLNHNINPRQTLQTSSMSPSSESPLRRPAYNQHSMVSHPSRTSIGATGSPSRFAPMGHLGNSANLPTLSVSGTNYIPSSPSPAASGGTSSFRDARLPSPWS